MCAKSAEDAFATRGFPNWKPIHVATTVFYQHKLGPFHEEAVLVAERGTVSCRIFFCNE